MSSIKPKLYYYKATNVSLFDVLVLTQFLSHSAHLFAGKLRERLCSDLGRQAILARCRAPLHNHGWTKC